MIINVDFVDITIDFVLLLSVFIITKYKHVINLKKKTNPGTCNCRTYTGSWGPNILLGRQPLHEVLTQEQEQTIEP